MSLIPKYTCVQLSVAEFMCVIVNGKPWINSSNVTDVSYYANAVRAFRDYVDDEDQQTHQDLVPTVVFTSAPRT